MFPPKLEILCSANFYGTQEELQKAELHIKGYDQGQIQNKPVPGGEGMFGAYVDAEFEKVSDNDVYVMTLNCGSSFALSIWCDIIESVKTAVPEIAVWADGNTGVSDCNSGREYRAKVYAKYGEPAKVKVSNPIKGRYVANWDLRHLLEYEGETKADAKIRKEIAAGKPKKK